MKLAHLLSYIAAAVTLSMSGPAEGTRNLRDGSRDMDFNLGTWHTEIVRTPDPFSDPSSVVRLAGTVNVKPVWNGKGQLEEIEADGPKGHWEGANLFFYDPPAHQWYQYYIASSEGRFNEPAGVGEYRDGNVEYYSPNELHGRAILDRAIWSDIKPDSHTYTESFSDDGGRTWHPAFVARLTRLRKMTDVRSSHIDAAFLTTDSSPHLHCQTGTSK
jgi:hypothetical protein